MAAGRLCAQARKRLPACSRLPVMPPVALANGVVVGEAQRACLRNMGSMCFWDTTIRSMRTVIIRPTSFEIVRRFRYPETRAGVRARIIRTTKSSMRRSSLSKTTRIGRFSAICPLLRLTAFLIFPIATRPGRSTRTKKNGRSKPGVMPRWWAWWIGKWARY